jgi:hypothetical protein
MRLTSHDLRDLQILKYYRLVRKWACKTYGLTDAEIEQPSNTLYSKPPLSVRT